MSSLVFVDIYDLQDNSYFKYTHKKTDPKHIRNVNTIQILRNELYSFSTQPR